MIAIYETAQGGVFTDIDDDMPRHVFLDGRLFVRHDRTEPYLYIEKKTDSNAGAVDPNAGR